MWNNKGGMSTTAVVLLIAVLVIGGGIFYVGSQPASVTGETAEGLSPLQLTLANAGEQSTLTLNAKDIAGDSEAGISGVGLAVYEALTDGSDGKKFADINEQSTATTHTKNVVGQVINIYASNSSDAYYCDPVSKFEVTLEQDTLDLTCYAQASESSMTVTVLDKDNNELSDSLNTTVADYNLTLNANQDEKITVRLANNQADKNFNLLAMCVGTANNIDDIVPQDSGWTKVATPENVSKTKISLINAEYDNCYVRDAGVLVLEEFDDIEIDFIVEAGSTAPDTTEDDTTDADACWVQFFDGMPNEGKDGKMSMGFFTKDDTESTTVGINEPVNSPVGGTSGAVIIS